MKDDNSSIENKLNENEVKEINKKKIISKIKQ